MSANTQAKLRERLAPGVGSLNPAAGPEAGGIAVVITGSNFSGATRVNFGSSAASRFNVSSSSSITALAPAGSGIVDVTVTTPNGTSATGAADRFTYLATAPKAPELSEGAFGVGPGTLGRLRYAADTTEWGSYANSTWAPWIKEHVSYLKLFPGAGEAFLRLNLGIPTTVYRDWDASWEGTYAPLNPERRAAFIREKVSADLRPGYSGEFLDDLNLTFRDNLQSKELEPERAEIGRFVAAVRAAWGPSAIQECNTQFWDAWPLMKAHNPAVEEELASCSIMTKEFGVGPTAGISSASAWNEFLAYVDALHARHIQLRMTGSFPVTLPSFELEVATYFLINQNVSPLGGDLLNASKQVPANSCDVVPKEHGWSCLLNTDLGEALGPRERSAAGVWKRAFASGVVYVNEPGNVPATVSVPAGLHNIAGESVTSLALAGDAGAVLMK